MDTKTTPSTKDDTTSTISNGGQSKHVEAVIDHLALGTTQGAMKLATFYSDVLGFAPIRFEEYQKGQVHFPSVRINASTILDFFEPESSDNPTSPPASALSSNTHLCFALSSQACDEIAERLRSAGISVSSPSKRYGARGTGISIYAKDPEGNSLEFRYYS